MRRALVAPFILAFCLASQPAASESFSIVETVLEIGQGWLGVCAENVIEARECIDNVNEAIKVLMVMAAYADGSGEEALKMLAFRSMTDCAKEAKEYGVNLGILTTSVLATCTVNLFTAVVTEYGGPAAFIRSYDQVAAPKLDI